MKAGGPGSRVEPDAAARHAERARGQHAEGQGRVGNQARDGQGGGELPGNPLRGLRPARRRRSWSRPRPTTRPAPSATCATIFNKGGGNLGIDRQRQLPLQENGRVPPAIPPAIDQDELELDLIDHGLEEMGESTGEKGEPQLVIRCAFADFGKLQEALEARGITPLFGRTRVHLLGSGRTAGGPGHGGADADRQARAGRRRAEGLPHARLSRRRACDGRGRRINESYWP